MAKQSDDQLTLIDSVLMAVCVDPKNQTEGACATHTPLGFMPLIATDPAQEPLIREQAKKIAMTTNVPIKLIRLTTRTEVASIASDGTETSLS
jgi:hypothetical protein